MSNPAVTISALEFKYPGQLQNCIEQINLTVEEGQRFGVFGPNGAGKTTLMNCMTGLLNYRHGQIQLLGNDLRADRKKRNQLFGLVPQDFSFYQELSPVENFAFFGAWSGMNKTQIKNKTEELLQVMDLESVKDKPVHQFSGGMKRRVNLAIGVIHSPRILFLDEPTVGVDVNTRQAIIAYLKLLNKNGTTLIYTSHQLTEAEQLCDRIALMNSGKMLAQGSITSLLATYEQKDLEGLFILMTGKRYEAENET